MLPDRSELAADIDEIRALGSINCDHAMYLSSEGFPEICIIIFGDSESLISCGIFETYINLKLNMLKLLNDLGHTPFDNTIESGILLKLLNIIEDTEDITETFSIIKPDIRKGVVWTPTTGLKRLVNYMDSRDMINQFAFAMSDSKE